MRARTPKKTIVKGNTLLQWCRSLGIAFGILGVGLGMTQIDFWIAAGLVYFGLVLIFLDCWFENFQKKSTRWIAISCIAAFGIFYSTGVVFRMDAIKTYSRQISDNDVVVDILNDSKVDIHDLDLVVRASPTSLIESVTQKSGLDGIEFLNPREGQYVEGDVYQGKNPINGQLVRAVVTSGKVSFFGIQNGNALQDIVSNSQRILCERIPPDATLKLIFKFDQLPKTLEVMGVYSGKFRSFRYKKIENIRVE
jgi:hypothetical protein